MAHQNPISAAERSEENCIMIGIAIFTALVGLLMFAAAKSGGLVMLLSIFSFILIWGGIGLVCTVRGAITLLRDS